VAATSGPALYSFALVCGAGCGLRLVCYLQKRDSLVITQLATEGPSGAVAGDLVVLDALRRANQAGGADGCFGVFNDEFRSFLDKPSHGLALVPRQLEAEALSDLIEAVNVSFRPLQVILEASTQLLLVY
jgi:hypothetical protein